MRKVRTQGSWGRSQGKSRDGQREQTAGPIRRSHTDVVLLEVRGKPLEDDRVPRRF